MNKIRQIQELNKKELEQGISPQASWHTDYRDTAFVYFGGLPFDLSEGDVITIFSQYGEPVFLKLARDRETGKSRGFGWLKYEDQRSCDLAVDNLGGASIAGRLIHVDHARYKARDDEDMDAYKVGWEDIQRREGKGGDTESDMDLDMDTDTDDRKEKRHRSRDERPVLPEERELERLIQDHDDEDPMKEFLIEEKKKEVDAALRRAEDDDRKSRHHRHRSHRSHRSHRDEPDEGSQRKRSRQDDRPRGEREERDRDRDRDRDRRRDDKREERRDDKRDERDRRDRKDRRDRRDEKDRSDR